jgi:hypothetical protein
MTVHDQAPLLQRAGAFIVEGLRQAFSPKTMATFLLGLFIPSPTNPLVAFLKGLPGLIGALLRRKGPIPPMPIDTSKILADVEALPGQLSGMFKAELDFIAKNPAAMIAVGEDVFHDAVDLYQGNKDALIPDIKKTLVDTPELPDVMKQSPIADWIAAGVADLFIQKAKVTAAAAAAPPADQGTPIAEIGQSTGGQVVEATPAQ